MKKEKGFTLIELLVVIAIIGILAAIAIPQFAEYRKRGFDARAKSDLRNGATAEEAYFVDNDSYTTCANAGACATALPGIASFSTGTTISFQGDTVEFNGTSTNNRGSGQTYSWDSEAGGLQ